MQVPLELCHRVRRAAVGAELILVEGEGGGEAHGLELGLGRRGDRRLGRSDRVASQARRRLPSRSSTRFDMARTSRREH